MAAKKKPDADAKTKSADEVTHQGPQRVETVNAGTDEPIATVKPDLRLSLEIWSRPEPTETSDLWPVMHTTVVQMKPCTASKKVTGIGSMYPNKPR